MADDLPSSYPSTPSSFPASLSPPSLTSPSSLSAPPSAPHFLTASSHHSSPLHQTTSKNTDRNQLTSSSTPHFTLGRAVSLNTAPVSGSESSKDSVLGPCAPMSGFFPSQLDFSNRNSTPGLVTSFANSCGQITAQRLSPRLVYTISNPHPTHQDLSKSGMYEESFRGTTSPLAITSSKKHPSHALKSSLTFPSVLVHSSLSPRTSPHLMYSPFPPVPNNTPSLSSPTHASSNNSSLPSHRSPHHDASSPGPPSNPNSSSRFLPPLGRTDDPHHTFRSPDSMFGQDKDPGASLMPSPTVKEDFSVDLVSGKGLDPQVPSPVAWTPPQGTPSLPERCHRALYRGCQGVFLLGLLTGFSLLASAAIFHRNHKNHLQVLLYIGALLAGVSSALLVIFCAAKRTTLKKLEQRYQQAQWSKPSPKKVQISPQKPHQSVYKGQKTSANFSQFSPRVIKKSSEDYLTNSRNSHHQGCVHSSFDCHQLTAHNPRNCHSAHHHYHHQYHHQAHSLPLNGDPGQRGQSCVGSPHLPWEHSSRCGHKHSCTDLQRHPDPRGPYNRSHATQHASALSFSLQSHQQLRQQCLSCSHVPQLAAESSQCHHSTGSRHLVLDRHASASHSTTVAYQYPSLEKQLHEKNPPVSSSYLLSPHHCPLLRSDSAPHYQIHEERPQETIYRHKHSLSDHTIGHFGGSTAKTNRSPMESQGAGCVFSYQTVVPRSNPTSSFYLSVQANPTSPHSSTSSRTCPSRSPSQKGGISLSLSHDSQFLDTSRQITPGTTGFTNTSYDTSNTGGADRINISSRVNSILLSDLRGVTVRGRRENTNDLSGNAYPWLTPPGNRRRDHISMNQARSPLTGSIDRRENELLKGFGNVTLSDKKGGSVKFIKETRHESLCNKFSLPQEQTYVNTMPDIKKALIVRCNETMIHSRIND